MGSTLTQLYCGGNAEQHNLLMDVIKLVRVKNQKCRKRRHTDWPPYLGLQVSDLMMEGGGEKRGVVARLRSNLNLNQARFNPRM